MTHVFAIPELTWHTASYLPSHDVAHLTQCSRYLHQTLLSTLYRHVEFSVYRITSMHWTLQKNPSFAKHTRSLSITMTGQPPDDEKNAYRSSYFFDLDVYVKEGIRLDIRKKLMTVIREFSKHGKLRCFSWDPERCTVGFSWMLNFKKMWSSLSRSSKSLKEIDCNFCLSVNANDIPAVGVIMYQSIEMYI